MIRGYIHHRVREIHFNGDSCDNRKGKMILNIAEMPIKCPVAPLEFVFMADWFFLMNGSRSDMEIELVTPLRSIHVLRRG
jgi:hypothetical protein